jgi:hypothetical protein
VRVVQRGSVAATLRLGCMAGDRVGTLTATTLLQAESVEAAALRDAVAAMVASAAEGDTPVDADDVSIVSAERVAAVDGACGVRVRFSVAVTTTGGAAMRRRSHRLRSLLATAPTNDAAQVAAVAARRLLQDASEDDSLAALMSGMADALTTADAGAFLVGAGAVEQPFAAQQTQPVDVVAVARTTMDALLATATAAAAAAASSLTAAGFDAASRDVVSDAWRSQVRGRVTADC